MARFPRIESPCPYKANLAAVMDGDHCRMCHRNVIDLTAMTDAGRAAFLASCEGEVCVSYRLPVRSALAAAAMAAAVAALPAAAQEVAPAPAAIDAPQDPALAYEEDAEIIVGGIKKPHQAQWVEAPEDATLPDMPVVYETPARAEPVKRN